MLKKSFRNTFYLPKTGQKCKIEQNVKREQIKIKINKNSTTFHTTSA